MLLAFFAIEEQFVFVIVTGIKGQFANDIFDRRPNGRQDLIDPVAFAVRNAGVHIQAQPVGECSMVSRYRLKILFLPVRIDVVNPCLRKVHAKG